MNSKQFRILINEMATLQAGMAAMSKFPCRFTPQIHAVAKRFNRLQEKTKNLTLEKVQELVSLMDWVEITHSFPGKWGLSGMVELTVHGRGEAATSFYILCHWEE